MKIISHRGYWKTPSEKNTLAAFERSFGLGFGTETDFREIDGSLVIAHDIPRPSALLAEACFDCLARYNPQLPLAVNIKADGLQVLLKEALLRHRITNYFLFDMSVPDAMDSLTAGLRVFTRQSDVEPVPAFYEQAAGVWMDAFYDDDWLTPGAIATHLDAGKQVCLVSPELHGRPHRGFWERLRASPVIAEDRLLLCTDVPEEALVYFNHAKNQSRHL
jgi:glycerophosphoryl diester phosphodiesterase